MWSIGILVFVAGTLLVTNVWASVGAKSSADQIARQYIRTYSEGSSPAEALATADSAAAAVAANRNVADYRVIPPTEFGRCRMVAVTIVIEVPAIALPFLGGLGRQSIASTRRELTDPYRSGDEEASDVATICD
jgi:hypothetical protein